MIDGNKMETNNRVGYKYNDGGRKDTGYKGNAGDCVVRAIAIALELPYRQVYDELKEANKVIVTYIKKYGPTEDFDPTKPIKIDNK